MLGRHDPTAALASYSPGLSYIMTTKGIMRFVALNGLRKKSCSKYARMMHSSDMVRLGLYTSCLKSTKMFPMIIIYVLPTLFNLIP